MKTRSCAVVVIVLTLVLGFYNNGSASTPCRAYCVGWAVGSAAERYAVILRTDDSGITWKRQGRVGIIPNVNLNGVSAVDKDTAWAVGGPNCPPYKTTNGGATWKPIGKPVVPGIFDTNRIVAVTRDLIWVTHDNGIYRTIDGGKNWDKTQEKSDFSIFLATNLCASAGP